MLRYSHCSYDYLQLLRKGLGSNPQLSALIDSVSILLKEYPFKSKEDQYAIIGDDLSCDNTKERDALVNALLTEGVAVKTLPNVFGVLMDKVPVIVVTDPADNPAVITHVSRIKTLETMLGLQAIELFDTHC